MNEMRCIRCDAWVGPLDRYCQICDARLTGIELELRTGDRADSVVIDPCWRVDEVPDDLRLVLQNIGNREILAEGGVVDSLANTWEPETDQMLRGNVHLGAGEKTEIPLEFSASWLDNLLQRASIRISLSDEQALAGKSILLEIYPQPDLRISMQDPFEVLLDGEEREEYIVAVEPRRGVCQISGPPRIIKGRDWLQVARVDGQGRMNSLEEGSRYNIHLRVDEDYLLHHLKEQQELRPELELPLVDEADRLLPAKLIHPLFHIRRPPTIQLGYVAQDPVQYIPSNHGFHSCVAGVDTVFSLQIDNLGDEELLIQSLTSSSERVVQEVRNVESLSIPSRSRHVIRFNIGLRDLSYESAQTEVVDILIKSNDPQSQSGSHFQLELEIASLKTCQEALIMDFGTSASVVALADFTGARVSGDQELINHPESSQGNRYVPTKVYYSTPDVVVIGVKADRQGRIEPNAIQQSFKRDLCSHVDRLIICGRSGGAIKRSAEQITQCYLDQFFHGIQQAIRARFSHLFLTHPVKFSLDQVRTLRELVQQSLGIDSDKLELWTEPAAGSLDYIFQRLLDRRTEEEDRYHLLVYDFGGGTTDISLLHVDSARYLSNDESIGRLKPELLGLSGDLSLGGDDLTNELISIFEKKISELIGEELVKQEGEGVSAFSAPLRPDPNHNDTERQAATTNHSLIRLIAESYKIFRSVADSILGMEWESGSAEVGIAFGKCRAALNDLGIFTLNVERGDKGADLIQLPGLFQYTLPGQPGHQGLNIKKRVMMPVDTAHRLGEDRIRNCIAKAKALWEAYRRPESPQLVVLPIGRSSALPLVRELLEEQFGAASDTLSYSWYEGADFKECITRGLQQLASLEEALDFDDSGLRVVTRALGWPNRVTGKFQDVISIGHPLEELAASGFIWSRYKVPRNQIVKIFELPESNIEEVRQDSLNTVGNYQATDYFSREELFQGLEVGLSIDKASRLRVRLRAGDKTIDPDENSST